MSANAINGVPIANIASVNGVPIANIAAIAGVPVAPALQPPAAPSNLQASAV